MSLQTLFEKVRQKKLTINQAAEKAGMHPKTFYYHYSKWIRGKAAKSLKHYDIRDFLTNLIDIIWNRFNVLCELPVEPKNEVVVVRVADEIRRSLMDLARLRDEFPPTKHMFISAEFHIKLLGMMCPECKRKVLALFAEEGFEDDVSDRPKESIQITEESSS